VHGETGRAQCLRGPGIASVYCRVAGRGGKVETAWVGPRTERLRRSVFAGERAPDKGLHVQQASHRYPQCEHLASSKGIVRRSPQCGHQDHAGPGPQCPQQRGAAPVPGKKVMFIPETEEQVLCSVETRHHGIQRLPDIDCLEAYVDVPAAPSHIDRGLGRLRLARARRAKRCTHQCGTACERAPACPHAIAPSRWRRSAVRAPRSRYRHRRAGRISHDVRDRYRRTGSNRV